MTIILQNAWRADASEDFDVGSLLSTWIFRPEAIWPTEVRDPRVGADACACKHHDFRGRLHKFPGSIKRLLIHRSVARLGHLTVRGPSSLDLQITITALFL